jgi:hypothetical protein
LVVNSRQTSGELANLPESVFSLLTKGLPEPGAPGF